MLNAPGLDDEGLFWGQHTGTPHDTIVLFRGLLPSLPFLPRLFCFSPATELGREGKTDGGKPFRTTLIDHSAFFPRGVLRSPVLSWCKSLVAWAERVNFSVSLLLCVCVSVWGRV